MGFAPNLLPPVSHSIHLMFPAGAPFTPIAPLPRPVPSLSLELDNKKQEALQGQPLLCEFPLGSV